jgi:hypothetical protein
MKPNTVGLRLAAAAALLVCGAGPVGAQTEPFRPPIGAPAPKATSALEATTPTAAEAREAKALTTAVFAKPAAAARAVDKVTAENQPDFAVSAPKPDPTAQEGLRPGGKGLEIKTPF